MYTKVGNEENYKGYWIKYLITADGRYAFDWDRFLPVERFFKTLDDAKKAAHRKVDFWMGNT